MGIDNFYTWIKAEYPSSVDDQMHKKRYDYIYVDANHILHSAITDSNNIKNFKEKIFFYLDCIFFNFIATKKIILAVDGSSPYSKVLLQRKRRLQYINKVNIDKLNSLHLTPGTQLMLQVESFLYEYVDRLKLQYKILNTQFIISPTTKHDEGELKIFKHLIQFGSNHSSSHLVIGNDADLVVLAMAVKPIYNIDLLIRHKNQRSIISIEKLLCLHYERIFKTRNLSIQNINNNNFRDDFVILSIMMGNDYIPKLNFVKFDNLWKSYISLIQLYQNYSLINHNSFNIRILINFFTIINTNLLPQFTKLSIYKYNPHKVINYLEGLLWCLNMYRYGSCPKYDFIYHFNSAPSPIDILFFLSTNIFQISCPISNTLPLDINACPLLLIPKKARCLIDDKYQSLIDNQLNDLYQEEDCSECEIFKSKLANLNSLVKKSNKSDVDAIKIEISSITNDFTVHKKSHNSFNIQDIKRVLQYVSCIK